MGKSELKVYDFLKTQIEQGLLGVNTKIIETELAETLNLSRSPVRRAVKRLATEGYLKIEANKGAIVLGKPLGAKDYVDQLEMFELLLIQFMFQVEGKKLAWDYPSLEADLDKLKKELNQQKDIGKTQSLVLEMMTKSLRLQKNNYYKKIILEITASLFSVSHLLLEIDDWQVLDLFQRHLKRWLHQLETRDFASARREVRILVNELTLAVIDRQDLNNLAKYAN